MDPHNHPERDGEDDGTPAFSARLFPHRSLGNGGFVALMVLFAGLCLIPAVIFLSMGAWPIAGFLGADIAILWFAFRMNYRAARAFEEVKLWRHALLVRKTNPAGRTREQRFNPFFTRFAVSRHEEIGITQMRLESRGGGTDVGGFLNPADRETFATAFAQALADVRR